MSRTVRGRDAYFKPWPPEKNTLYAKQTIEHKCQFLQLLLLGETGGRDTERVALLIDGGSFGGLVGERERAGSERDVDDVGRVELDAGGLVDHGEADHLGGWDEPELAGG